MTDIEAEGDRIRSRAGTPGSVQVIHEEHRRVTEPTFTAVIERAGGRCVDGFASGTVLVGEGHSWSSEVSRPAAIV